MKLRAIASESAAALADKIEGKSVVPTALRSADIEKIPAEIYTRSLIAAGVEDARWMSEVQGKLADAVALRKEAVAQGEAFVTRSSFVGDMRERALDRGISDGTGGLTDVASARRLRLIYDMQTRSAQGYAKWKRDQGRGIRVAFPAQELVRRIIPKGQARPWSEIWEENRGQLYDGRMIALKGDEIWTKISRFGTPWPPFDYGSGMGLRDVSRREAIALGVIEQDFTSPEIPEEQGFNDGYEADISDMGDDLVETIIDLFGSLVETRGSKLIWRRAA